VCLLSRGQRSIKFNSYEAWRQRRQFERDERQGEVEQREGAAGNINLGLRLKKISYLYNFFSLSAGLVKMIRFNRFQTLETKPNQNFL